MKCVTQLHVSNRLYIYLFIYLLFVCCLFVYLFVYLILVFSRKVSNSIKFNVTFPVDRELRSPGPVTARFRGIRLLPQLPTEVRDRLHQVICGLEDTHSVIF